VKRLLKYIRGYVPDTVFSPLLKLLEATLELIVPLIIADIIDVGIKNGDTGYIFGRFFMLVALGALGLVFSVTAQYFAARASCGYAKQLRLGLFSHIQSLSYTELDKIGTPTLITRMSSDSNTVQSGLNLALRLLLRSPFVVFGAMIMAFTIDTESALTFAVVIPLLAIVVYGIMFISMPMHKRTQASLDAVVKKTKENLEGARVLRAFTREDGERFEFAQQNSALESAQRRVGRISALLNPLTFVIINLGIIYLIYTGAIRVERGDLTTGQVVALYNYMSQILVELIKLANLVVSITKAIASASRINKIFDIEKDLDNGTRELDIKGELALEFKNVSLTYHNAGAKSLSNISFKVKRGDTVGIIGATGSGKTSLINLIPRFYEADEGEILLDGVNISEYSKKSLNERIALVTQKVTLFSGTIRDNLTLGRKNATDEELYSALRAAAAEEITESKGGLDGEIAEAGKNLSGGQKQRLSIARALVMNPLILILDDATSALDYATDLKVRTNIKNISSDITTFIVSQRVSSVMHADLIITLEDGEICGIGTHKELLSSSSVYREIFASQFGGEEA
jgi:ABC-type multidrug transport system fused ATPase/permease subunit